MPKKTDGEYGPGDYSYEEIVAKIGQRFGEFHSYILNEILIHNWDCSGDEYSMKLLRESLDWIVENRLGGGVDPLRNLLKATERANRVAKG